MQRVSKKLDRTAEQKGPIRPGSPLHHAISMIAENIAKKHEADASGHKDRSHSHSATQANRDVPSANADIT